MLCFTREIDPEELTVVGLKELLRYAGASTTGNKSTLMARLLEKYPDDSWREIWKEKMSDRVADGEGTNNTISETYYESKDGASQGLAMVTF